jgi:hypothetical protein
MTTMIPEAKFCTHQAVNGRHYGVFVVMGHRWSETVGEHIYGVVQVNEKGKPVSREMNMVESALTAA